MVEYCVQHVLLDVAPLGEEALHIQLAGYVVDEGMVYSADEYYSGRVLGEVRGELNYEFELRLLIKPLPHHNHAVPY